MIFNAKTYTALALVASAGLMSARAAPVANGGDASITAPAIKRGFWDDVSQGWDEFKKGFHDGFDSEQARPLAPEEAGQKRDVKSDFLEVAQALRRMGINAAQKKPPVVKSNAKVNKRDFWDAVSDGWDDFKEGFHDGFDSEQDRPLAPEEAGKSKRSAQPYVIVNGPDGRPIRPIRLPYGLHADVQARSPADDGDSALDDIGSGIGKGFGSLKDTFIHGIDEAKANAERILHPDEAPKQQRRDSWEDDAGNVVGALAGWGSDHIGRISFKRDDSPSDMQARDSWEDDLGNIAGAGAGWISDHVGRIDPTDLIPEKGAAKKLFDN